MSNVRSSDSVLDGSKHAWLVMKTAFCDISSNQNLNFRNGEKSLHKIDVWSRHTWTPYEHPVIYTQNSKKQYLVQTHMDSLRTPCHLYTKFKKLIFGPDTHGLLTNTLLFIHKIQKNNIWSRHTWIPYEHPVIYTQI